MLEWAVGDFDNFCNNVFEVRLGYRFKLNCDQFSGHKPSSKSHFGDLTLPPSDKKPTALDAVDRASPCLQIPEVQR
jgi:hypothetical protein